MRAFRLIRGVLSTALVWACGWAVLGTGLAAVATIWDSATLLELSRAVLPLAVWFGLVGAWAGGVFATIMAISERRRTFSQLSMRRVVAWGVLGGISYPVIPTIMNLLRGVPAKSGFGFAVLMTGAFGAVSAWGMLRAARRGGSTPPSQLGEGSAAGWDIERESITDREHVG